MARVETYRPWSASEVAYLHDHYDKQTAEVIAEALNRTAQSVWEKGDRENLRKHAKRHARNEDGPWYCPKCGKTKEKSEFGKSSSGRGAAYCKSCTNKLQQERRNNKKNKGK